MSRYKTLWDILLQPREGEKTAASKLPDKMVTVERTNVMAHMHDLYSFWGIHKHIWRANHEPAPSERGPFQVDH
jgi:hypothetical protein